MKYECTDQELIMHEGIPITIKELILKGKPQERFFIYDRYDLTTCGGAGWKDVEEMIRCYKARKYYADKEANETNAAFERFFLG